MKSRKCASLLLTLAFMLALTACTAKVNESPSSSSAPTDGAARTVTFTDMTGRTITLEDEAERIVALTAADCEILYALGASDKLVGRGEYCDYPAEVLNIPSVQSGSETNIEQIIALKPDVLVMGTIDQTEEQVASLEAAGIKVVVSDADDIEGVYTAVNMLGTLTGNTEEAASVIDSMKSTFAQVSSNDTTGDKKTVYFEVSPLQYGLWTAGSDTFMDEIATMLGLENVFSDISGWGEISEEQVLSRNPDYIVTISMYFGEGPTPEEEIMSRAGWENVEAVKTGAILNLANNEISRPAPRLAEGAKLMYDFINNN